MATIEYEETKNRLVIKAGNWEEGNTMMMLPSRRWMPARGVFVIPMTRVNMLQIMEANKVGKFDLSTSYTIRSLMTQTAYPTHLGRQFPSNYEFPVEPFPDQRKAIHKIFRENCGALFMRPGAGKSYVAISIFSQAFTENCIDLAMVLCPLTVTTVWAGEDGQIAKYCPHLWQALTPPIQKGLRIDRPRFTWLIVGIESLSQGGMFHKLTELLAGRKFGLLVDESSRIKNHKAIRTERAMELGQMAKMRLIASGTPAVNTLVDLYAQFEFLDPNIIGLGDFYAFRSRYCRMGGYKMKQVVGYDHVDELMGLIEPYSYRCDKPEGIPAKLYSERWVSMLPQQRLMYTRTKGGYTEGISVANILNRVEKLAQIAGGYLKEDPRKVIDPVTGRERKMEGKIIWAMPLKDNPKIQAMLEFIEEIGDAKCVFWAKHLWEVEQMERAITDILSRPVGRLIGSTSVEHRANVIKQFQEHGLRYIVGNQQTGGIGITLTAAHYSFYYSNTFSLEDRIQSEDRLHRIGQHNEVLYVDCRMEKSVDNLFKAALQAKLDMDKFIAKALDEAGVESIKELI